MKKLSVSFTGPTSATVTILPCTEQYLPHWCVLQYGGDPGSAAWKVLVGDVLTHKAPTTNVKNAFECLHGKEFKSVQDATGVLKQIANNIA